MELDINQIKTLYSTWKVIYQKKVMLHNKEVLGMICYGGNFIKLATNYSIKGQKQTLMHESLHGITTELKIELKEEELDSLANSMVNFIEDNPEFIKVILEGSDSDKKGNDEKRRNDENGKDEENEER